MQVLLARNVNYALPIGLAYLDLEGERSESRGGDVVVAPEPVTTIYEHPDQRVLFLAKRDCNPFFHLMESIWMLAGREDVAFVKKFVKRMEKFSDDKLVLSGAYGYRWRHYFGHDQLHWAISRLRDNPDDRRVVIGMYDPNGDHVRTANGGLDIPCNLQIAFRIRKDTLDMTVFNRSNDIIWGAYGANAVHMSYLQEYVARSLGVELGFYRQVSNNYHAYLDVYSKFGEPGAEMIDDRYAKDARPWPLMDDTDDKLFDRDLLLFFEDPYSNGFHNSFFHKIAKPMYAAHEAFKKNKGMQKFGASLEILEQMPEQSDWRIASEEWITRRHLKWAKENDDGVNHQG